MFSGIVEELGTITSKKKIQEGYRFRVRSKKVSRGLKVSGSVAVNGVCHTIVRKVKNEFEFVTMHETLKKTNLGKKNPGDDVNLERSLRTGQEIGGHFVLGHVDDTGTVTKIKQIKADRSSSESSDNWEFFIKVPKKFRKYIINVGSIAVDGVSLTVAEVHPVKGGHFGIKVAIIPYTYKVTNFHNYRRGDRVNLEFDFLGKYVLNLFEMRRSAVVR